MRIGILYVVIGLLIAIFAIGAAPPAKADCAKCHDCSTEVPAKNETPCPEKGIVCQIATTCAGQLQKMPVPAVIARDMSAGTSIFAIAADIAIKLAFAKPETSPPRA
jgi:hypothetical protein